MIPIPERKIKPTGILKVHFTMPIPLKNNEVSGLMMKALTVSPTTVERIIAGIKDKAVCKMSCLVVKPSDF